MVGEATHGALPVSSARVLECAQWIVKHILGNVKDWIFPYVPPRQLIRECLTSHEKQILWHGGEKKKKKSESVIVPNQSEFVGWILKLTWLYVKKKKGDKTLDSDSVLIHCLKLIKMGKSCEYKMWHANMGWKIEIWYSRNHKHWHALRCTRISFLFIKTQKNAL